MDSPQQQSPPPPGFKDTDVRGPDGGFTTVRHPEGAADADILAFAAQNYKPTPQVIGKEGLAKAAEEVGASQSVGARVGTGLGTTAQWAAAGLQGLVPDKLAALSRALGEKMGLRDMQVPAENIDIAQATERGGNQMRLPLGIGRIPMGSIGVSSLADIAGNAALLAAAPASLTKLGSALGVVPRLAGAADTALTSGLTQGAVTPGNWQDRAKQAALAAAFAGAVPIAAAAGGAVRRVAGTPAAGVGERILQQAGGEEAAPALLASLEAPYAGSVLGVKPSAAMQSGNPTLATLELGSHTRVPDLYAPRDLANATARWAALEGLADPEKLAAAVKARQALEPSRQAALSAAQQTGGYTAPILAHAQELTQSADPSVRAMGNYVAGEITRARAVNLQNAAAANGGHVTGAAYNAAQEIPGETLHTVRKVLTTGVPKGTELGSAITAARAERMGLVNTIDEALDSASGGAWSKYMQDYGAASLPVTSASAAQKIATRFNPADLPGYVPPAFGASPAPQYLARELAKQGQKQFGAKMVERMLPEDRATINAIVEDLGRQQMVRKAQGVIGSDTAAKLAASDRAGDIADLLIQHTVGHVPLVGPMAAAAAVRLRREMADKALGEILQDPGAMANAIRSAQNSAALARALAESSRVTRSAGLPMQAGGGE